MIDALCILAVLAFFGALLHATAINPPRRSPPPSPVRLHCSICVIPGAVVDAQEYARMSAAGEAPYCEDCMATVQIYEQRRGRAL